MRVGRPSHEYEPRRPVRRVPSLAGAPIAERISMYCEPVSRPNLTGTRLTAISAVFIGRRPASLTNSCAPVSLLLRESQ